MDSVKELEMSCRARDINRHWSGSERIVGVEH